MAQKYPEWKHILLSKPMTSTRSAPQDSTLDVDSTIKTRSSASGSTDRLLMPGRLDATGPPHTADRPNWALAPDPPRMETPRARARNSADTPPNSTSSKSPNGGGKRGGWGRGRGQRRQSQDTHSQFGRGASLSTSATNNSINQGSRDSPRSTSLPIQDMGRGPSESGTDWDAHPYAELNLPSLPTQGLEGGSYNSMEWKTPNSHYRLPNGVTKNTSALHRNRPAPPHMNTDSTGLSQPQTIVESAAQTPRSQGPNIHLNWPPQPAKPPSTQEQHYLTLQQQLEDGHQMVFPGNGNRWLHDKFPENEQRTSPIAIGRAQNRGSQNGRRNAVSSSQDDWQPSPPRGWGLSDSLPLSVSQVPSPTLADFPSSTASSGIFGNARAYAEELLLHDLVGKMSATSKAQTLPLRDLSDALTVNSTAEGWITINDTPDPDMHVATYRPLQPYLFNVQPPTPIVPVTTSATPSPKSVAPVYASVPVPFDSLVHLPIRPAASRADSFNAQAVAPAPVYQTERPVTPEGDDEAFDYMEEKRKISLASGTLASQLAADIKEDAASSSANQTSGYIPQAVSHIHVNSGHIAPNNIPTPVSAGEGVQPVVNVDRKAHTTSLLRSYYGPTPDQILAGRKPVVVPVQAPITPEASLGFGRSPDRMSKSYAPYHQRNGSAGSSSKWRAKDETPEWRQGIGQGSTRPASVTQPSTTMKDSIFKGSAVGENVQPHGNKTPRRVSGRHVSPLRGIQPMDDTGVHTEADDNVQEEKIGSGFMPTGVSDEYISSW
jgi:hypothetical protein